MADRQLFPMPIPGAAGLVLVVLSTYIGGLSSGLVTGALAIGIGAVVLSSPGEFLTFEPGAAFRLSVLVVVAPVLAIIVALLQARVNASLAAERAHRERLEADNRELETLRAAIDQINLGVMLLDRDMRARFISRSLCEQGRLRQPLPGEKPSFEDLVRQVADNGTYAIRPEERDAYVASRVKWASGDNPSPYEIHRADGRITRVKCIVLRDGARMLTYTDETETLRHVDRLEELVSVDPLTGLHNRRYFEQAAEKEWSRFQRYRRPLSLLIIDIDRFKSINDRFGHDAGDVALREIASVCSDGKRECDIVARIGGEEFAVLLPETGLDKAIAAAERIRQTVAARILPIGRDGQSVTLSIGVATADAEMTGIDALTKHADVALYAAKGAGRNRVMSLSAEQPVISAATAA